MSRRVDPTPDTPGMTPRQIRKPREWRGWPQRELAAKLNCSEVQVRFMEKGRRPIQGSLLRLLRLYYLDAFGERREISLAETSY